MPASGRRASASWSAAMAPGSTSASGLSSSSDWPVARLSPWLTPAAKPRFWALTVTTASGQVARTTASTVWSPPFSTTRSSVPEGASRWRAASAPGRVAALRNVTTTTDSAGRGVKPTSTIGASLRDARAPLSAITGPGRNDLCEMGRQGPAEPWPGDAGWQSNDSCQGGHDGASYNVGRDVGDEPRTDRDGARGDDRRRQHRREGRQGRGAEDGRP